jgi:hypothetical protein
VAWFKYSQWLQSSSSAAYDALYNPGDTTPYSGVYRCETCGSEIVSEQGKPFPPQNHHVHLATFGPILWRLLVFAEHKPR